MFVGNNDFILEKLGKESDILRGFPVLIGQIRRLNSVDLEEVQK